MTDKQTQAHADEGNTQKDPHTWTTGDEPMTGAQRSYLSTLAEEAKVDLDENMTKAQASMKIEELQGITGRGKAAGSASASETESQSDTGRNVTTTRTVQVDEDGERTGTSTTRRVEQPASSEDRATAQRSEDAPSNGDAAIERERSGAS